MRVFLIILMLLPTVALADYKSDYKKAVEAAERQDWATVDSLMRRAITEKPDPDPKARIRFYGQRFEAYLPQFYLGLSAFSRNDCEAATELLSDPRIVAAARGMREESRRLMMLRTCKVRLAKAGPQPSPPTPTVEPAPVTVATRPPPTSSPPPSNPVSAPPRPVQASAAPASRVAFDSAKAGALDARIERIGNKLTTSEPKLADAAIASARSNWQRQRDSLKSELMNLSARAGSIRRAGDGEALVGLERELSALDARADKYAADLTDAVSRGRGVALADARSELQRGVDAAGRVLSTDKGGDSREAQSLRKALQQARAQLAGNDAARIQSASAALDAAMRQLETGQARSALAGQVRSRLGPLASAFLSGDLAQVARWDGESELASVPAAHAEALLMRAAARFELYVLGGERDAAQFEGVRSDLRAARRVSATLKPSEKAYSPRFRALFASTR